jgi:ABC-type antimicrobial peptide transport system permease subunit
MLRVLGQSQRHILTVYVLEFFTVGLLASLLGLVLGLAAFTLAVEACLTREAARAGLDGTPRTKAGPNNSCTVRKTADSRFISFAPSLCPKLDTSLYNVHTL